MTDPEPPLFVPVGWVDPTGQGREHPFGPDAYKMCNVYIKQSRWYPNQDDAFAWIFE